MRNEMLVGIIVAERLAEADRARLAAGQRPRRSLASLVGRVAAALPATAGAAPARTGRPAADG